jgi:hypothetical protein
MMHSVLGIINTEGNMAGDARIDAEAIFGRRDL